MSGHGPPAAAPSARAIARLRTTIVALTVCLIVLDVAWETVLAPLRPGGSLLVFKVLPLVFALPAFWKGRIRAYQLWSMLILAYLCEGVVRGMSDAGLSSRLGWAATLLAAAIYVAIIGYVRLRRRAAQAPASAAPA
jgi:uncharacterized membrane protein